MDRTPLGPLASGKQSVKKRRHDKHSRMNVARAPDDPTIAFSPRQYPRGPGRAGPTRESAADKRKVSKEAERQWLAQRDGNRFKVQNFRKPGDENSFATPARGQTLNLAKFPSIARASGAQTPRGDMLRTSVRRAVSAREDSTSTRQTMSNTRGIMAGSLSSRLGCPIRPSPPNPSLSAGVFARPYSKPKQTEAEKKKSEAEAYLWYLKRAMRSLRCFELQWKFVCSEMEGNMEDYKKKAQQQLAEGAMATFRLQLQLSSLKETKATWEAQFRSRESGKTLAEVMNKIHENRVAFLQRIKVLKRSLTSALEGVPLDKGVTIGHGDGQENIKKLGKYLGKAMDILSAIDMSISQDGYAPTPTRPVLGSVSSSGPSLSRASGGDAELKQSFGGSATCGKQHGDLKIRAGDAQRDVPMRPAVQRAVETGKLAKETKKYVKKYMKGTRAIHGILVENVKKQQTLGSVRLQMAEIKKLVEEKRRRLEAGDRTVLQI